MKYKNIVEGKVLSRPNRFIAKVEVCGKEETVHVKNTGRCKELLVNGNKVYLETSDKPERKTKFDIVAVEKGNGILVNMDSQIVNDVAEEWVRSGKLFPEGANVYREVTYGNSRFDLYVEWGDRRAFIEVKGVTLEDNGEARFPDAPTERGVKHVNELINCLDDGYEAYILFIIQMKGITHFKPNDSTHKAFGDALRKANACGVKIIALDCNVSQDSVSADNLIEVIL